MKKTALLASLFFSLTACVSSPRYMPQTMFPHGPVKMTPKINTTLSTPLNKVVEIEFFNDNKEWVEIEGFTLETSKENPSGILTDQESIDQWMRLRAEEKIARAGTGAAAASFGFALLGIGVAIAEIASGDYDSSASTAAFLASDTFAVASVVEEENTIRKIDQSLQNAPLSSKVLLPPGRAVTRWFVISTPDDELPSSFFINYTAKGRISGVEQPKFIELVNESSDQRVSGLPPLRRKSDDIWAENL